MFSNVYNCQGWIPNNNLTSITDNCIMLTAVSIERVYCVIQRS